MYLLKLISLTLMEMAKQVWLMPTRIAQVLRRKRRQFARDQNEVERLDRIRNPSKYLGK